jgi:hypothetical protein
MLQAQLQYACPDSTDAPGMESIFVRKENVQFFVFLCRLLLIKCVKQKHNGRSSLYVYSFLLGHFCAGQLLMKRARQGLQQKRLGEFDLCEV